MNKLLAKEILIRSKRNVFNNKSGNNNSILSGQGLNFKEIREYSFGDDVRKINWKSTAKMNGKPYINIYSEEKELNIVTIFLADGNIEYGLKKQKMSELNAIISLSAIKNGDNIRNIYVGKKIIKTFPPTKNIGMVLQSIQFSLDLNMTGTKVNYSNIKKIIENNIKQKSIIFIIGDFFQEIDLSGIGFKHEIYAIIIRDITEEVPIFDNEELIIDPITLNNDVINFNKGLINKFKIIIEKNDIELIKSFNKNKIKYKKIYTNDDLYLKLKTIMND